MTIRIRPCIVLFGDSLTQLAFGGNDNEYNSVGWASLLASAYSRRADVLNRGFRGYNTAHALAVLPSVFQQTHSGSSTATTLFCTVFFGANDCTLPQEKRHTPIDKFGDNIRKIVTSIQDSFSKAKEQQVPPIILLTPPPVDQKTREQWCLETYGDLSRALRTNDMAKRYGQKVKEIAQQLNCPVVDTFTLLGGDGNVEDYGQHLCDGLHLTASGNTLVYKGLMNVIQTQLPELMPMTDGQGRHGSVGVPFEEMLWTEYYEQETSLDF